VPTLAQKEVENLLADHSDSESTRARIANVVNIDYLDDQTRVGDTSSVLASWEIANLVGPHFGQSTLD
jgi:hypothetical protein